MSHVVCEISGDGLVFTRDGSLAGIVSLRDGEPTIVCYGNQTQLTFNDIAIIMDNWAALEEMKEEKLNKAKLAKLAKPCPWCGTPHNPLGTPGRCGHCGY